MIGARAVMGVGAAFVMPATLSILAHVFPPDERPRAIAIWAGFAGVGVGHRWRRQRLAARALLVGLDLPHQRRSSWSIALVAGFFLIPSVAARRSTRRSTRSARCCRSPGWARSSTGSSRRPTTAGLSTQTLVTFARRRRRSSVAFVAWELRGQGADARPAVLPQPAVHRGDDARSRSCSSPCSARTSSSRSTCSSCSATTRSRPACGSCRGRSPTWCRRRSRPKLVERFGQRRVVSVGPRRSSRLGIAIVAVTSTVTRSYWWFALAARGRRRSAWA